MKPAVQPSSWVGRWGEILSQISFTQRVILMTAAVFGVAAGVGIFAIQIPWQESRRKIAALYQENIERASVLALLQGQTSQLHRKENELLMAGGSPVLTSEVTKLAAEARLEIESVIPQTETALAPYTKFQIEVSGSASPEQLLLFLQKLEQHRPLLTLDEMAVGNPRSLTQPMQGTQPFQEKSARPAAAPDSKEQPVRFLISAYSRAKAAR